MADGGTENVPSILLVDDHVPNLIALEAILQPLGCRLVRASSGEEALRFLLDQTCAVALLDVQMPGMDGYETARLIRSRERSRTLPILFLTAFSSEEARVQRAYASGAVDFLTKPLEANVLRAKVAYFVDLHRRMEELRHPDGLGDRARQGAPAPFAVWAADEQGRLLSDSPGWRAFTGQSAERLVGTRAYLEAVHPEDRERMADVFRTARSQGAPFEHAQRVLRRDGSYRRVLARAAPVRDAEGSVREYVGTLTDVTEQQRSHEAAIFLAEASELLSASLDDETTLRRVAALTVPALADFCAVDVLDPDGASRRVAVSHRHKNLDDRALKLIEIHGLDPSVAFGPLAVMRSGAPLVREVMDDEFVRTLSAREEHLALLRDLRWRSGMIVPLQTRGRTVGALSLFGAEGRRYGPKDVTLALDLARRCALCWDNARLYAEARAAVRFRDEFLSVASHELKTPLTPLSLRLEALQREAHRHPEEPLARAVQTHVEIARSQVKRLADLVNNLLDVSGMSGGQPELYLEQLDGATLVREVVERFQPLATQVGSALQLQLLSETVLGRWDRRKLGQIVGNLVSNALKYGAGKPVSITLQDLGERVVLMVTDAGIGIAPEHLQRIFERFGRAVSHRHYGGLGLGLFITHQLIAALGGTVHVRSEQGQGSTFTVLLPKDSTPHEPVEAAPQPPGWIRSQNARA
jgi:PAS domain S-box-containing protein